MSQSKTRLGAAILLLLGGCSLFRWSGYKEASPDLAGRSAVDLVISTQPARSRPPLDVRMESALAQASAERRRTALFYSDLGPDTVDVSSYPAVQRHNYEVYARVCARCHSLARSINAPHVGRTWWELYVRNMRLRARLRGERLKDKDVRPALDFLVYDSHERKVAHAAQFEEITIELKRRFEAVLDERVDLLQKQPQPRLLP
ncbi:MAG: hypothetical protein AAB268_05010 [Elusimicrobiota bacterium]